MNIFGHDQCDRACARSSVIVVPTSGEPAFWQNCTNVNSRLEALSFILQLHNVIKMPRKFYFMWCLLFVKMLALKCTYLTSNLSHQISNFQSHNFERFFEKMAIRCTFIARILNSRLVSPHVRLGANSSINTAFLARPHMVIPGCS